MNIQEITQSFSYEQLANALYLKGEQDGFVKVTDKTKWREPVMADKLGHKAHSKISAGAGIGTSGTSIGFSVTENNYLGKGIRLETSINFNAS